VNLVALRIADPPERWRALGFELDQTCFSVGGIAIELGGEGRGITAWSVEGLDADLDGLPRFEPGPGPPGAEAHSNAATGIDQVVVATADFERTARELERAGIPLKRIRDGGGFRQGFRRLGPAILELVEARAEDPAGPARFWGLVVVVPDLDELKSNLGELIGTPTDAVQAGRRIVTVRKNAGLTTRLAFMTPEPG
jgi:hypothetical protein